MTTAMEEAFKRAQDRSKDRSKAKKQEFMAKVAVPAQLNYELVGIRQMPWRKFAEMADHPHQRDTARHAMKPDVFAHLTRWTDDLLNVAAVITPNGKMHKLDGHSRMWLLINGHAKTEPGSLNVAVYQAHTDEASNFLYNTFNDVKSAKKLEDELVGALRFNDVRFESQLLGKTTKWGTPLKFLDRFVGKREYLLWSAPGYVTALTEYYGPELAAFDQTLPKPTMYTSSFIIGALLTFILFPDKAPIFWSRYNENLGKKVGGESDSVQQATDYFKDMKAKKHTGSSFYAETVKFLIRCVGNVDRGTFQKRARVFDDEAFNQLLQRARLEKHKKSGLFVYSEERK